MIYIRYFEDTTLKNTCIYPLISEKKVSQDLKRVPWRMANIARNPCSFHNLSTEIIYIEANMSI